MGKKMKLVLDDLKVKSFVTALEDKHARQLKGGDTGFCTNDCTEGPECEPEVTLSCGGTCHTECGCNTQVATCYCTDHTDCTCPVATC